jgi:hypothetical protein
MKIKVLNEIENSDLLRIEINKEIRIIYKRDLEKYKGVRREDEKRNIKKCSN